MFYQSDPRLAPINELEPIEGVSSHDTALRPYELASEGLDTNQGVLV
jgi:hypothetical protein